VLRNYWASVKLTCGLDVSFGISSSAQFKGVRMMRTSSDVTVALA
jgi:hypothetical protein